MTVTLGRLREEENNYNQLPHNNQNTLIHCLPVRTLEFHFINVHGCNFMRFFSINSKPFLCCTPGRTKANAGINQLSPIKGP